MRGLKKRREAMGMTIAGLSLASGIPETMLMEIERGWFKPSRRTLLKLARPLMAEVGDFTHPCANCDGMGYKSAPGLVWRDN